MIEYFTQLFSSPAAIVGVVASLIVLVSMCFDTSTRKGDLLLRSWNLDGNYRGLSAFILPKKMSSEEVEDIVYKIENDIPLDED